MKSLTNKLPCVPSRGPRLQPLPLSSFPAPVAPPAAEEERVCCFPRAVDSHFPLEPPPCPPRGVVVVDVDAEAAVLDVNAGATPAPPAPTWLENPAP